MLNKILIVLALAAVCSSVRMSHDFAYALVEYTLGYKDQKGNKWTVTATEDTLTRAKTITAFYKNG